MLRVLLFLVAALSLAACGAQSKWATDDAVFKATYIHDGPPMITLFTVIANRSGAGAHSALLINGSERVFFDPAGSWHHPNLPERNDVHFGITNIAVDFYIDYHSRITHHTVRQDIIVSAEVAEMAMRAVKAYGPVSRAMCGVAVARILRGLPGFENLPQTPFPKRIMQNFGELPGVTEQKFFDDDPEENSQILVRGI